MLINLENSAETIIDRDPFIFNPHPQFEPGVSEQLMIQHNRGGQFSPEGKRIRLVGPEGATLYLLSVPGGERTELQVGKPFTTAATGHETWIGKTKEILLTVMADGDYAPDKGNLLAVRAGSPPRVVAKGYKFNHLGVSRCGRFFCCDDWQGARPAVHPPARLSDARFEMGNLQFGSKRKPSYSRRERTRRDDRGSLGLGVTASPASALCRPSRELCSRSAPRPKARKVPAVAYIAWRLRPRSRPPGGLATKGHSRTTSLE